MKCLVTGAAGFIGSHLCDRLIEDGHDVVGIDDLSNGKVNNLSVATKSPRFHMILGNINGELMDHGPILNGTEWIFHLAAKADLIPSIERPLDYHKTNVTGTIRVLELARKLKIKRFIYAASSSMYGIPSEYPTSERCEARPLHPYALTKLIGDYYVNHWSYVYNLPTTSLRIFNAYGPRHRTSGAYGAVFGVFLSQLANGLPLTIVGDGKQLRDFVYISDVVEAFVLAARGCEGSYNVGSGNPRSVNELALLLGAKDFIHIPDRPGEPRITHADITLIVDQLGWKPRVSFEEGVEIMRGEIPKYKNAPLWTKEKIEKATESWFKYLS